MSSLEQPPGAVLFADLGDSENLPEGWSSLSHALGGLLCASLNGMASEHRSFRWISPARIDLDGRNATWYSSLPYEAVCTENLSPFLKLLPCHGMAGIAALLRPYPLAESPYFSIGLRAERANGALRFAPFVSFVLPSDGLASGTVEERLKMPLVEDRCLGMESMVHIRDVGD